MMGEGFEVNCTIQHVAPLVRELTVLHANGCELFTGRVQSELEKSSGFFRDGFSVHIGVHEGPKRIKMHQNGWQRVE